MAARLRRLAAPRDRTPGSVVSRIFHTLCSAVVPIGAVVVEYQTFGSGQVV